MERVCQLEANLLGALGRKIHHLGGDIEVWLGEAQEDVKRHATDALKGIIEEEKRQHVFTEQVLSHARELERRSSSSSSSINGSAIYRSSTSSRSSVFVSGPRLQTDDDLVNALDLESAKMTRALEEFENCLW